MFFLQSSRHSYIFTPSYTRRAVPTHGTHQPMNFSQVPTREMPSARVGAHLSFFGSLFLSHGIFRRYIEAIEVAFDPPGPPIPFLIQGCKNRSLEGTRRVERWMKRGVSKVDGVDFRLSAKGQSRGVVSFCVGEIYCFSSKRSISSLYAESGEYLRCCAKALCAVILSPSSKYTLPSPYKTSVM